MASSGRVPVDALRLMQQTITVIETTNDGYGKLIDAGAGRSVACLLQPGISVYRTARNRDVIPTWVAYCDDINIDGENVIEMADGSRPAIKGVQTFTDERGAMFQQVDFG